MLLFLDFDGVTHPWPVKASSMYDKQCIQYLREGLGDMPVRIVISSTWREHLLLSEIKEKLGVLGSFVCDVTPFIDDPFLHHVRYHEVMQYLEGHGMSKMPWIAIDDEQGNYPKDLANVLITDRKIGFTKNDRQILRTLLSERQN